MKKIYRKMMVLMNRKQKLKMVQILFMMVIGAILETVSIGLVVPAIQMIMDPSCVEGDSVLAQIYRWTGFQKPGYFTTLILVLIILGFVLKNVFLYFQNVVQLRFVYTNQFETSQRMMINFMKRPYEYYLNADTSVIQRMITSDVNNMYGLILALLQLMSEVIIFVLLAVTLTAMAPQMILTVAALLIVTLLVIKQFLKPIMRQAGIENQDYYSGLYKWIEESVMGIKEIKIANKENYFIREYGKCGHGYVSAVQKYNIFNATPRLLIETVCMAGLILYLIFMILSGEDVTSMVSQLGAFGVVAMRLLPSANRINNYLTQISYFEPFFMGVSDNLQEEIHDKNVVYDEAAYRRSKPVDKLPLQDKIVLDDIVYKYPNSDVLIFDHAHMEIPAGKSVGIVGTSGAGKTTIVDIMLGLLSIQEGHILADGVEVRDHYESWLKNIGYIPQTIFMIDSTIRKNVAFGYADEDIIVMPSLSHIDARSEQDIYSGIVAQLLSAPKQPTAICVSVDAVAAPLLKELRRMGWRVPQDVSLVGFDDDDTATALDLTTMHQDPAEIGRIAARKTLALLNGETLDEPFTVMPTSLVLRGTTERVS